MVLVRACQLLKRKMCIGGATLKANVRGCNGSEASAGPTSVHPRHDACATAPSKGAQMNTRGPSILDDNKLMVLRVHISGPLWMLVNPGHPS